MNKKVKAASQLPLTKTAATNPGGVKTSAFESFTPKMAEEWLRDWNTLYNRTRSEAKVQAFADDQASGKWDEEDVSNPIIIATTGHILNGQHRLAAQLLSRATITYLVVRHVDPRIFPRLDQQKPRSGGDMIEIQTRIVAAEEGGDPMKGYVAREISAMIPFFREWDRHQWTKAVDGINGALDKPERLNCFVAMKDDAVVVCTKHIRRDHYIRVGISSRVMWGAICSVIEMGVGEEVARTFIEGAETGAGLAPDSPILALRNTLNENRGARRKMSRTDELCVVIRAWNAHRAGRKFVHPRIALRTKDQALPRLAGCEHVRFGIVEAATNE